MPTPLTIGQIVSAYSLFLGREPESMEVIRLKLALPGMHELIRHFVSSDEFALRHGPVASNELNLEQASILLNIRHPIERNAEKEASLEAITSQLCSASQFASPIYQYWCDKMHEAVCLHRKQWEFVYVLQALEINGALAPGKRGLGFGCGREPLPAIMADRGCTVLATDLDAESATQQGWSATNQHSAKLDDLFRADLCEWNTFLERVSYQNVNMNEIPQTLQDFDFVWSSCAFEHLGSIELGIQFVLNSVKCLKPGGIAVHTTEFNLSSNDETFENESLVFFRQKDIEQLIAQLESSGCSVAPLNLAIGERVEDGFVDLPPFKHTPHLKLAIFGHVTTSIGLIITKNA